ncbi:hypothetical protein [uncultured Paraglaciecola sp.]|uniref:hypothetical protein n=1 Tax=uncultured Paraglaciecola sp. TaxID=1765024 RepID=UPI00261A50B1|nr:hypothetical protein [uncultured Paraglaciecola sp.]
MGKSNSLINQSVRMTQSLHKLNSDRAQRTNMSVSAVIRMACEQFNETEAHVDNCKRLIEQSKLSDIQLIKFAGMKNIALSLYLHKNAFPDLKNADKNMEYSVMEFMRESIENGTLLSKGETKAFGGSSDIILFRVNKMNVYCQVGPGQITILSVVN